MADEDARQASEDARQTRAQSRARDRKNGDGRGPPGLGFSLPPMSLPKLRLPERIRLFVAFPEPPEKVRPTTHVRVSHVLLAVLLADALDALAVAFAGPTALPWARAAAGTLLSVVFAGGFGLAYAWELLAILTGFGWLSLAPTVTLLVLARMAVSE